MNFKRKKIRGQNQKVRRTWLSEERYRIVWRSEAFGIEMPPRFQAAVRIMLPNGGEMWDFVSQRRLFKTLKAAVEACEKHYRLWLKASEASGIRALQELFGKVPVGFPLWVKPKLSRKVYGLLTDTTTGKKCELSLDGPTETSSTSVSPTANTQEADTPVSYAEDEDGDTPTLPIQSWDTSTSANSTVPPVEARAKGRKASVTRRTTKQSQSITKKHKSSRRSSGSDAKRSPGSRRKKSTHSGS